MRYAARTRVNFLVRALVALAPRRVRLVREAARTEADGFAAAGKAVLFEYRARRGAHGAAAEGVRAEVAVRARPSARGAENRLEAAPGITERGGPLLDGRGPRRHLPEPGERRRRREQIAGDDGCYYFEQVGRHGVRRGYSRAGIIVKVSCLCSIYPAGVRRSALSETATWQRQSASPCPRRRLRLNELSSDPLHAAGPLPRRGALFSGFTVGFGCQTAKRGS